MAISHKPRRPTLRDTFLPEVWREMDAEAREVRKRLPIYILSARDRSGGLLFVSDLSIDKADVDNWRRVYGIDKRRGLFQILKATKIKTGVKWEVLYG